MLPGAEYHPVEVRLNRGDAMLMFTDGIDEARGDDGFYGVDRLVAFLPAYAGAAPEVICEAVEQHVLEYLDGRNHDDIAMLAVTCGN
jgi:serine phosphatase RsbU (regulator of sigma subunit)